MKVTISRLCGLVLPLWLASAGCHGEKSGGSAGTPSAGASAAAIIAASAVDLAPASPPPRPRMRHFLSLAGILLRPAMDLPSLTDDQRRAIAHLQEAPADAEMPESSTPLAAQRTFQADLVTGIRAGKLDNTKLRADYVSLDKAVAAATAQDAEALDSLQRVLDASQREALADHVRVKRAARPLLPLSTSDGGIVDLHRVKLDRWSTELGLDDEQEKHVAAVIAKDPMTTATVQARRDGWQKRIDTMVSAFVKDSFEARTLDLSSGSGKTPHETDEAQATFIDALLPVLHADQLTKLAVRLERGANRPGRGGDDLDMGLPPVAE
jgi:hypothetical protein